MSWDGTWTKISESGIGTNTVTGKYKLTELTRGNTNSRTVTITDGSGIVFAYESVFYTKLYFYNQYTVEVQNVRKCCLISCQFVRTNSRSDNVFLYVNQWVNNATVSWYGSRYNKDYSGRFVYVGLYNLLYGADTNQSV